jgi:hypothetical protein
MTCKHGIESGFYKGPHNEPLGCLECVNLGPSEQAIFRHDLKIRKEALYEVYAFANKLEKEFAEGSDAWLVAVKIIEKIENVLLSVPHEKENK